MGYKNAVSIFPTDLLKAIQQYIDGEYIYIPRKAENKKRWGEVKPSRQYIQKRNEMIFSQYQDGISVEDIASCNYLSPKTIYKILADMKNQC
ncbi:Mor family transcriptional regulator [Sporomusaceae bacterium BoRhaA]|uniref:CD3324 family protein n=1 Tax=Pelorhabdus rhamnosifermentans TaxID=2772457 RepID=UPI001C05FB9D|nr:CD3324 family protein [Pelorhabdus rhamnosifermentans]MBU2699886.1 Mor family transcriptional regulator [Pelorhabdus rhamnosifermentans]